MIIKILSVSCFVLLAHQRANCQEPASAPNGHRRSAALSEIGRSMPWRHIGSPPAPGAAESRLEQWRLEDQAYREGLEIIKQSWTGEAVDSPDELRFRVAQYEDLVRTVTDYGGYGNLVLADVLRRLSIGLLSRYSATHPSEYEVAGDLLTKDRVRLLDCPATEEMVMDELNLAPPSGKWRLSERREELDLIFHADGSTLQDESGRMLMAPTGPSKLMGKRNVSSLLYRLIDNEATERMVLAGFVEFLKQGGTTADLKSFDRIMGARHSLFRFDPIGGIFEPGQIAALVKWFQPWSGRVLPFASLVGE